MTPSYAFVGQPQTGVVERFFRTLKEQVVHGRVFETLEAFGAGSRSEREARKGPEGFRDAVRAFIARCDAEWLIEKNGFLSPHDLRRKHELAAMPMAAQPKRAPKEPGPVHADDDPPPLIRMS